MSCYHPLKGFIYGKTVNGKDNYIITSQRIHHIEIHKDKIVQCGSTFISPRADQTINTFTEIPCGKCIGCRLEHSRQWANRCLLEMKEYDKNCFITLTYDNEHVPYSDTDEREFVYGEVEPKPLMTLRREHLTKFIKRLRGGHKQRKIRYFACGEYGSKTSRPHYHLIIFGWCPNDLKFYKRSEVGYNYYNSETLQKLWPYGYAVVGEATWETAAYTARYCMKKLDGELGKFYESNGIEKEFITMSRKPGIAKDWYSSHNDYYATFSSSYVATDYGNREITPIRYFDKLFDLEDPVRLQELKQSRKEFAEAKKTLKLQNTTKIYEEMMLDEELNTIQKTKSLVRKEF